MTRANFSMSVRVMTARTSIIDITGELNAFVESALMEAYAQASTPTTRTIGLNFNGLDYMNSSGIGLLVTFPIRTDRQKQRLLAFGKSERYGRIFALTRLNEAIGSYSSEAEMIEAAGRGS